MIPVVMMIDVTVGPITVTFNPNEGDVLHYISASEFAAKVMELANYIGPEDDPPIQPTVPEVTTGAPLTGENAVRVDPDLREKILRYEAEGQKLEQHPLPLPDDDDDDDVEVSKPSGTTVGKSLRSKDKTLARFLESEV